MQTIEQDGALKEVWHGGGVNKSEKRVTLTMEFLEDLMADGLPENLKAAGYPRLV